MCGITLLASLHGGDTDDGEPDPHRSPRASFGALLAGLRSNSHRRGPDHCATVTFQTADQDSADPPVTVSLTSSVLGLRGHTLTEQPLASPDGRFLFAWNGQIFDWDCHEPPHDSSSSRVQLDDGENDGQLLFATILHSIREQLHRQDDSTHKLVTEALRSTLSNVDGPYAFVFIDKSSDLLMYGRDPLGRRSLLLVRDPLQGLLLASVSCLEAVSAGLEMSEVDCSTLWSVDLRNAGLLPQRVKRDFKPLRLHELDHPSTLQDERIFAPRSLEARLASAAAFEAVLERSVRSRVTGIRSHGSLTEAHIAILFSGGLDCATLARLADRFVPPEQPIDLLNVGFENPRAIKSAKLEAEKALKRAQKLEAARERKTKPSSASAPFVREPGAVEGKLDGGGSATPGTVSSEADVYDVPDRLTGRATYAELVKLAPNRRWNFVEINVPYVDYCKARPTVEALMHPTASVMDLSIASALYFASRGQGQVQNLHTGVYEPYTTSARVLISGLGADELLGGYSRHRHAFAHKSWTGLVDELQLDLVRLPTRNLGRDDRILSTFGREARYPFLSHSVVSYLTSLPILHKADLRLHEGEGDKLLLRDLASSPTVGLVGAARLRKRAMQFGTRAAKIEEGQGGIKGHERVR